MGTFADMARSMAASQDMTGVEGGQQDMAPGPETSVDPTQQQTHDPMEDIQQGIALIEGAVDSLPGALAEKARGLIEGLKDIAMEGESASGVGDSEGSSDAKGEMPPDVTAGGQ